MMTDQEKYQATESLGATPAGYLAVGG